MRKPNLAPNLADVIKFTKENKLLNIYSAVTVRLV